MNIEYLEQDETMITVISSDNPVINDARAALLWDGPPGVSLR